MNEPIEGINLFAIQPPDTTDNSPAPSQEILFQGALEEIKQAKREETALKRPGALGVPDDDAKTQTFFASNREQELRALFDRLDGTVPTAFLSASE